MKRPTHLVRAENGPDQAIYPATGSISLRRIMKAIQGMGYRTKVYTWSNKAKAYLS